jgi:hypothetical protein
MKTKLYSIRDNIAEVFNKPFTEFNDASATRAFINSAKENPNIKDYSLYLLGEFDDNGGHIIPVEPVRVYSGTEIKSEE